MEFLENDPIWEHRIDKAASEARNVSFILKSMTAPIDSGSTPTIEIDRSSLKEETISDAVIRFAGESQDGIQSIGGFLARLAERAGQVVTYVDLCEAIGSIVTDNTIATHVGHVRDKFQQVDPTFPRAQAIRAVTKRGYRWETPEPAP